LKILLHIHGSVIMVFALVPAAGQSRRMGRPKLGLPLGDCTVLECVVRTLRAADMSHILVVVGPHVPELAPLAEGAGALVCQLGAQTPDMRATIECGLHWLEQRFHPRDEDAWLLVPADHPTLDATVVRQLVQAWRDHGDCSIIIPTHAGRRGHPTLIGWQHVPGLRRHPSCEGLNTYLRQYSAQTLELPVSCAAVLHDLDTPEDYESLRATWAVQHK
jgi:CTP:molybdopterin cytidylyltransferase MocA